MAVANSTHTPVEPEINVWISPLIEREFKRRDVFQELRLENAHRIKSGATGVYLVSVDRARELLADAESHRYNRDQPRGLSAAYTALFKNITRALREEACRGAEDDPGMAEVKRRRIAASACFRVGDRVLYFGDDEEYGEKAVIVEGYGMYPVADDDGPYIDSHGDRLAYRYGYSIRVIGQSGSFFATAYDLTRNDRKPSHLRLVA